MGVCILGMGSCGSKSDVKSITNIQKINQTMTNMVTSKSQTVQATQLNIQSNSIDIGGDVIGCKFENEQQMNATQKVSITLDLSSTTALQTQVSNALKAANDSATSQKVAFLQTASTTSNNYTSVNEAISNLVSTNINDTVRQELSTLMQNAQKNEIRIKGNVRCTKENPTVSSNVQNMVVSQISEALTKAITGTTLSSEAKSETGTTNTVTTKQEGEGISGVFTAILNGLTGLMTGPFLIIGLVVVVLGVLAFVFRGTISKIAEKKLGFGRRHSGRSTRYGRRRY
jgi:hypothetical protein